MNCQRKWVSCPIGSILVSKWPHTEEPESKDVPRLRKKAKVAVEPIIESSESDEELTMLLESINTAVHGIQKEMVADRVIWKEVLIVSHRILARNHIQLLTPCSS